MRRSVASNSTDARRASCGGVPSGRRMTCPKASVVDDRTYTCTSGRPVFAASHKLQSLHTWYREYAALALHVLSLQSFAISFEKSPLYWLHFIYWLLHLFYYCTHGCVCQLDIKENDDDDDDDPVSSAKKGRLDTGCVYPQLCLGALVSLFPDDVSHRVGLTASRRSSYEQLWNCEDLRWVEWNKKAQLSPTNPRDAKACQKLLQFDVLTTFSLTILVYLHSFSCCCVRNLRNPEKFSEISNL